MNSFTLGCTKHGTKLTRFFRIVVALRRAARYGWGCLVNVILSMKWTWEIGDVHVSVCRRRVCRSAMVVMVVHACALEGLSSLLVKRTDFAVIFGKRRTSRKTWILSNHLQSSANLLNRSDGRLRKIFANDRCDQLTTQNRHINDIEQLF